jgi:hypothetical protein
MKTTPLILFFILLVVLVMSIVFSRYLPLKNTQEGLIGFNANGQDNSVNIPQYNGASGKVVKHIHDSLYFDTNNGNLIEVNGKAIANVDQMIGNTEINGIAGITRNQATFSYNGSSANTTNESKITNIASAFNYFMYTTPATDFGSNDKYKVVYISYGTDTILQIFKIDDTKYILLKTVFINSASIEINNWDTSNFKGTKGFSTTGTGSNAVTEINLITAGINNVDKTQEDIIFIGKKEDGTLVDLYQIMKSCVYDQETGNLGLLKSNNGSTPIPEVLYDRSGTQLSADYKRPTNPSLKEGSFKPWAVVDSDNNLIIVYPYANKTFITVLREVGNDGNLSFGPVVRFNGKNLDNGYDVNISGPSSSGDPYPQRNSAGRGATGTCGPTDYQCLFNNLMKQWFPNGSNNVDMMYELWLPYFNSLVSAGTSNDYMLKTQIVPPVCPSCPSCNCDGGVCSSCGGNGGSGTNTNNKTKGATGATGTYDYNSYDNSTTNKILNDNKSHQDGDSRFQGPGVGGTISNVTGDVTGLVGSTVGTAGSIVNNAVSTAGGLLYSAGSGAVNLLKSAGQGQSGPVGINYQTQQPGVQQRDQYYSQGQTNTPIDNYSQYGALQSRAGNYMPMTADFSSFGK